MKTLSLWQPWATLIAIGAKKVETRSWYTPYRGLIAIHAAKRTNEAKELEDAIYKLLPSDATQLHTWPEGTFNHFAITALYKHHNRPIGSMIPKLPFGAVLCTAELIACLPSDKVGAISDQERAFGNYASGRWAWVLSNIQMFNDPVPAKGAQGFWNFDYNNSPEPTAIVRREAIRQGILF